MAFCLLADETVEAGIKRIVVVVVSFSIVTGSPVRESYCTERVVTVFVSSTRWRGS